MSNSGNLIVLWWVLPQVSLRLDGFLCSSILILETFGSDASGINLTCSDPINTQNLSSVIQYCVLSAIKGSGLSTRLCINTLPSHSHRYVSAALPARTMKDR